MNASEIRELWVQINSYWQHFDVPKDPQHRATWVASWLAELEDIPADIMLRAVMSLGDREHPPRPGQLRTEALRLECFANGVVLPPDVDEAWNEVNESISRVGRYETPAWSHPAVAATVATIGWKDICSATEMGVLRGQFTRLYEVCKDRHVRQALRPAPSLAAYVPAGLLKRADDANAVPPIREIGPSDRSTNGHDAR